MYLVTKLEIIFTPDVVEQTLKGARLLGKELPADFNGPKFDNVIAFEPCVIDRMFQVTVPSEDGKEVVTYVYPVASIARIKFYH